MDCAKQLFVEMSVSRDRKSVATTLILNCANQSLQGWPANVDLRLKWLTLTIALSQGFLNCYISFFPGYRGSEYGGIAQYSLAVT